MAKELPKQTTWVFFGIGAVLFLVVLFTSLSDFSFFGGYGYAWADSWPTIVAGLIFLGIMGWVIKGPSSS